MVLASPFNPSFAEKIPESSDEPEGFEHPDSVWTYEFKELFFRLIPGGAMLDHVEVKTVHELVEEHIRAAIHLGVYGMGDRLPREQDMARLLGVSRVTIREALYVLQAKGYVTSRRGARGGWFVTGPRHTPAELSVILHQALPRLEQVLEFRAIIEGAAAELAAARRSAAALEELDAAVAAIAVSQNIAEFRRADSKFHLGVAEASGNAALKDAVANARMTLFVLADAVGFDVVLDSAVTEHTAVLDAIRRQDAAAARALMVRHIETTRTELHHILAQGERSS
jgi:DNA-binding FadR family transcriptional regulator